MNQENSNPPAPTTVVRTTGNGGIDASTGVPSSSKRPKSEKSEKSSDVREKEKVKNYTFFFLFVSLRISNMI